MHIITTLKEKYNLSIWLDYLDYEIIQILPQWVKERKIYGITTNPTIFNNAINKFQEKYIKNLDYTNIFNSIENIMIEDVKKACDIMLPIFEDTNKQDGFVSIELPPYIAYDTEKTINKAREIWQKINMPNLMIKIPATNEGLIATQNLLNQNININITLLFNPTRYEKCSDIFKNTQTNSHSVASFFVSRVDSVIDDLLYKLYHNNLINHETYNKLVGKVAIANSLLSYKIYKEKFQNSSKVQRILWASTSTKNPSYHQLKYVLELLTPNSINTIPLNTYQILISSKINLIEWENITNENLSKAEEIISSIQKYINLEYILEELLYKGVTLFSDSYNSILNSLISLLKTAT